MGELAGVGHGVPVGESATGLPGLLGLSGELVGLERGPDFRDILIGLLDLVISRVGASFCSFCSFTEIRVNQS